MITDLLNHIANHIIASNQFLDKICPIAFKMPDNTVVGYTTESDYEFVGISDQSNRAGYIRYESEIQYTDAKRAFSSSKKFKQATVAGNLVVFSFSHDRFNPIMLGQKLSDDLQNISFASYLGGENSIKINVKRVNTDPLKVYSNETGKTYDGGTGYSAASVQFDLTYTTSEERCLNDCDIFQKYINCDIIPSSNPSPQPNKNKPLTCETLGDCETFKNLEDRVSELEDNPGGGGGLTCEDLPNCELIQTIQQAIEDTNSALNTHISDQSNPHNITASQVGAPTVLEAQAMADQAEQNAKTHAEGLVVGLLDDRGSWDASGGLFPNSGGSGPMGAIQKGDLWFISVAGNLGGEPVTIGDSVRAMTDIPGQTAANWNIIQVNITYVPVNKAGDTMTGDLGFTNAGINTADYVDFNTAAAPLYKQGRIYWNDVDKTLSVYDDISGTSMELGQESVIRARNNTGAQINNGQVVYISGALGQNPTCALAMADSETTSRVLGIATHNIANNTIGKITVLGLIKDIDTSGFVDGDALYLSATTPGALVNTPPGTPNFTAFVGYVAHAHINQGKILCHPDRPIADNIALGTSNAIAPSQNAVKTYADTLFKKMAAYNNLTASHTGNTTETIIRTVLLPANTMDANSVLEIISQWNATGTAGNKNCRIYLNTAPNLTGSPKLIGTNQMTAAGLQIYCSLRRRIVNKNSISTNSIVPGTGVTVTDDINTPNAFTALNWDFSADTYVICTMQLGSAADTGRIQNIQIEISKP